MASTSRELHAEVPLNGSTGAELWARMAVRWVQEQDSEWVLAAGRAATKKDGVEHVIHKKDGTIGGRSSYGNDPHPPKG